MPGGCQLSATKRIPHREVSLGSRGGDNQLRWRWLERGIGVSAVERLRARAQGRRDDYALCPEDGFWFRPSSTEGKCPLCGVAAPGGSSLVRGMDRSRLGLAGLALQSLAMPALVLVMYFRG